MNPVLKRVLKGKFERMGKAHPRRRTARVDRRTLQVTYRGKDATMTEQVWWYLS